MTIPDAARNVLLEAGKPLSVRDIYECIVERQLYDFRARDPISVVRSAVRSRTENIHNPSSKSIRLFRLVDGGKFLALDSPIHASTRNLEYSSSVVEKPNRKIGTQVERVNYAMLQRQVDACNAVCRDDLLRFLKDLNWEDFENFASRLLRVYGFEDVKVTRRSNDGGIDGHGRLKVGLAYMNVAFQCKRWTAKSIGRVKVDEFRGTIQGEYEQGVFFSTSTFSASARDVSIKKGAVPVVLIDGDGIVDLMIEKEFGVQRDEVSVYSSAPDLILETDG